MSKANAHFIPSIAGLRAVAILAVITLHAGLPLPGGYLGVDIFFVLSGFLITGVLFRTHAKNGRVSIGEFYWGRMARLTPAVLFAAAAYAVASWLLMPGPAEPHMFEALYAATYTMNLAVLQGWRITNYLNHTWSLAIETQFYFVWAPLVAIALAFWGKRSVLVLAVGGIVAIALWRVYLTQTLEPDAAYIRIYHGFDTRGDELLVGCALAVLLTPRIADLAARTWILPAAYLGYAMMTFYAKPLLLSPMGPLPVALAAAWLIAGLTSERNTLLTRLLSTRPFMYLGALSYSMYLWNWLLVIFLRDAGVPNSQVYAFLGTFVAAAIAYHLVETPARKLLNRIAFASPRSAAA